MTCISLAKPPNLAAMLLGLIIFFAVPVSATGKTDYRYDPTDTRCGGFPRLPIETAPGMCVGHVLAEAERGKLRMPRRILALPGREDFLLTDMGSWAAHQGAVWLLKKQAAQYVLVKLMDNRDRPHGLALGPDGKIYVGEVGRIIRFTLDADDRVAQVETVVDGLPAAAGDRHPLAHFVFDAAWNLYVNVGAYSDQCESKSGTLRCAKGELPDASGSVRKYVYDPKQRRWQPGFSVEARGLRNSLGLAVHASGSLLQAENSMDFNSPAEPYEEINLVKAGKHYGWPYCYDFQAVNPIWQAYGKGFCNDLKTYAPPYVLMPPHTAPLDMLYYQGGMFPEFNGWLVLAWHGYRETGHRVVAYPVDAQGLPVLTASAYYHTDAGQTPARQMYTPAGGGGRFSQHRELVSGWHAIPGVRPKGAPTGLAVAHDGALWIVEDKNRTVLRLAATQDGPVALPDAAVPIDTKAAATSASRFPLAFAALKRHCAACHTPFQHADAETAAEMLKLGWVAPGKPADSLLWQRLTGNQAGKRMPPVGALAPKELEAVRGWIVGIQAK